MSFENKPEEIFYYNKAGCFLSAVKGAFWIIVGVCTAVFAIVNPLNI